MTEFSIEKCQKVWLKQTEPKRTLKIPEVKDKLLNFMFLNIILTGSVGVDQDSELRFFTH